MLEATIRRPHLSESEAQAVAEEHYGLAGSIASLASERDQNFKLSTAGGEAYVLKVARAAEAEIQLEAEHALLAWATARDASLPLPRVVPTLRGDTFAKLPVGDGHLVRMLRFLPGVLLAEAHPHSAQMLQHLGGTLGRLNAALAGFDHPGAHREFLWDLTAADRIIDTYRGAVGGALRGSLIEYVRRLYDDLVQPVLRELRRSVIYNDANDHNVLLAGDPTEPRHVAGLIDFGDIVYSATVCDLAVAVAYSMLGKTDPLAAAAQVTSGFHRAFPLDDTEMALVYPLALARLTMSVCISASRAADHPDDDYLQVSAEPAWLTLERLADTHPTFAATVLRAASGLEPSATAVAVRHWIENHATEFAPVVQPDPRTARRIVLDLSVGSPLLSDPMTEAGTPALADKLARVIADAGADIGIGRYDEPRLWYTSESFRGTDPTTARTVHLGIDLFLPAGTPIAAPWDAVVHSVQENSGHLDYGPTVILEHTPDDGPRFYTLYGHLAQDVLASLSPGDPIAHGASFASLGTFEENGHWPPHLHFQVIADVLGWEGDFPGVAPPDERTVWRSLCPDPSLVLGLPVNEAAHGVDLLARRREALGPSLSLAYAEPLTIVRGRGAYLYDVEGRAFLDCVNNVCHVGHTHPRVVRAATQQMAVLNTNTRYLHETILTYAERLRETLPDPLSTFFFVNSGSEANELALRLARAHTGRSGIVVIDGAYHGHTSALIDISPYKFARAGGSGRPAHVRVAPTPDAFRGRHRGDDPQLGATYAQYVGEACADLAQSEYGPAAFIAESLLSCAGQIEPPQGYLHSAYAHAHAAGAVCIADEVQIGFGRVGSHFWGFETQGVVPDIVTMGKPIGNGHPLGCVVTTRDIAASFDNGMEYFNTFGGNPVSGAVGLAVLDVIRDEGLQQRAHEIGGRLKHALADRAERHAVIGDVRGRGLFLGIEMVDPDAEAGAPAPSAARARYIVERMKDRQILLSTDGPDNNVLKFKPPLVFDEPEADRFVTTLSDVMRDDFVQ